MTSSHRHQIPQEERVSAHISQVSNTRYISVVLEKFDSQQKRLFEECCIGHVAKLPELKFSGQLIHELINRLVVCGKLFEAWFKVNQRFVRFGLQEFALITCLKCSPIPTGCEIEKILQKSRLWDKLFPNRNRVTCADLETAFLKCANRNDRYKLGLALLIEGVFHSRDRNVGIHHDTLSIVDDLDFFDSYPWGTVCFQLLIKSLIRGWGRMADMVKVNDSDRMAYTLYGFSLAFQLWVYEAIPESGARFSTKTGDDIPRMLRWSGTKTPHSRTYSDFFEKTHVHLWVTLRPNPAEELQPYYTDLVTLEDEVDPVLDGLASECTVLQDCPPEQYGIRNVEPQNAGNKSRRGNRGRHRLRNFTDADIGDEDRGDIRPVSVDDIKILLNEQRKALETRLGEFREEMNVRFATLEKDFEGHVDALRKHVTDQINVHRHTFHAAATNIGVHTFANEHGTFGQDSFDEPPRNDDDHIWTPNASADKQLPGEPTAPVADNINVMSRSPGDGVALHESVVDCDNAGETPNLPPAIHAQTEDNMLVKEVIDEDNMLAKEVIANPSKMAEQPVRRPRSLRLKMPSAKTKTPFTRSGRKKGNRDA